MEDLERSEYASIVRELHIDASPDIVFDVVSRPEHIGRWWSDEAELEPTPGATGHIIFRRAPESEDKREELTVVDVDPPTRFSFRWVYTDGAAATADNSLLVTFDLEPAGSGTRLTMTETGFRERGWEAAVLEAAYLDHIVGWDHFMPRLDAYTTQLARSV